MSNTMDITENDVFYVVVTCEVNTSCSVWKKLPNRVFIILNLYDCELFKELTNHKNVYYFVGTQQRVKFPEICKVCLCTSNLLLLSRLFNDSVSIEIKWSHFYYSN
jgi:hypothetical protein